LAAQYDGDLTYREVKQHGDFGIGATARLAGEVIALKGEFYELNEDGVPHLVDDSVTAPFATVKFFRPDKRASLNEPLSLQQLAERLDTLIPTKNAFHAIEIQGTFKSLKVRNSLQPQSNPLLSLSGRAIAISLMRQ
jgi:acetolactate decarboxylase